MAAASEAGSSSFDWGGFATGILNSGFSVANTYLESKKSYAQAAAEASKADAAQKNYESSLNFANIANSKVTMIAIAVVGAVIGLFLIFRK